MGDPPALMTRNRHGKLGFQSQRTNEIERVSERGTGRRNLDFCLFCSLKIPKLKNRVLLEEIEKPRRWVVVAGGWLLNGNMDRDLTDVVFEGGAGRYEIYILEIKASQLTAF